jgi:hypothetical protein
MKSPHETEKILNDLLPYLTDLVRESPEYGNCGIDFVLHAGRIVRVEKKVGISIQAPDSQVRRKQIA